MKWAISPFKVAFWNHAVYAYTFDRFDNIHNLKKKELDGDIGAILLK